MFRANSLANVDLELISVKLSKTVILVSIKQVNKKSVGHSVLVFRNKCILDLFYSMPTVADSFLLTGRKYFRYSTNLSRFFVQTQLKMRY